MYSVIDGNVVRSDDGFIAVQHRNSNPTALKIGDVTYHWIPKNQVSLAWVHTDHLGRILAERAKVCCGAKSNKFFIASYVNVNLWTFGTREYQEKEG